MTWVQFCRVKVASLGKWISRGNCVAVHRKKSAGQSFWEAVQMEGGTDAEKPRGCWMVWRPKCLLAPMSRNEAWMAGFAAVSRARRSGGGRYSVERRTSDSSEHTREP